MVPCETFVPRARGTFVSPDGGVAKAFPPYAAPPTSTSRRAKSQFRLMPFPFRIRLQGRQRPKDTERTPPRVPRTYFVPEGVLSAQGRPGAAPDGRSAG